MRSAIGIDPDSKGFVCVLVKPSMAAVVTRNFLVTEADLESFLTWVKEEGEVIIGIEGSNGLSRPIEKVLREAGIIFYSFAPADTDRFRKAVLGQNKDNRKDAESVARLAMALESQGRLERYRRVWFVDMELQLLSRSYERRVQAVTAEVNRLWKLLRHASPELYLALGGKHPELELRRKLETQGFLSLLSERPNVGEWKDLSETDLLQAMGGMCKGRRVLVGELRKAGARLQAVTSSMALLIRTSARHIAHLRQEQQDIVTMLEEMTKDSLAVQALRGIRGIGTITATTMVAEIVDIRRFAREDRLARYSGLGMREHSTGETARMVASRSFNPRLKDAFITAALNFVHFNPDSHLSGYYRNLVKKGMAPLEAAKRVARALVRVIYRKLNGTLELGNATGAASQEGESDMANGFTRGDESHPSNMPPSPLLQNMISDPSEHKGAPLQTPRLPRPGRVPKKSA